MGFRRSVAALKARAHARRPTDAPMDGAARGIGIKGIEAHREWVVGAFCERPLPFAHPNEPVRSPILYDGGHGPFV